MTLSSSTRRTTSSASGSCGSLRPWQVSSRREDFCANPPGPVSDRRPTRQHSRALAPPGGGSVFTRPAGRQEPPRPVAAPVARLLLTCPPGVPRAGDVDSVPVVRRYLDAGGRPLLAGDEPRHLHR